MTRARTSRRRALTGMSSCLTLGALAGCRALRDKIEVPVVDYPYTGGQASDTLLILVPGATDTPRDIERHGVIELLRERGCEHDVIVPYRLGPSYLLGDVTEDLHRRVAAHPDYARRVWLTISAGALVGFAYAREHADMIDHMIAYAPFLGPALIIDEIEAEGGLASWTPNEPIEGVEEVWLWLRGYADGEPRPRLDLLWGDRDPGDKAIELLAAVLPESRRHEGPGEHGWDTFMSLLRGFLDEHPAAEL